MEDREIVALYWARDEEALRESEAKYGRLLYKLSLGILCAKEDCEEVVDDALLAAWNAIPPARPENLGAYLSRIVRNLSIKKFRYNNASKRKSEYAACLEELSEFLPSQSDTEGDFDAAETGRLISDFLRTLPPEHRRIFVRRFYYFESPEVIAGTDGINLNTVKSVLYRTKQKLAAYLAGEGVRA